MLTPKGQVQDNFPNTGAISPSWLCCRFCCPNREPRIHHRPFLSGPKAQTSPLGLQSPSLLGTLLPRCHDVPPGPRVPAWGHMAVIPLPGPSWARPAWPLVSPAPSQQRQVSVEVTPQFCGGPGDTSDVGVPPWLPPSVLLRSLSG